MSIRKMELICIPCSKCNEMKKMIEEAILSLEREHKIKISYEFKHTQHFRDVSKYSVNASQAPILIINGHVECAGRIESDLVRRRLAAVHRE